jgi:hypothetical protein
MRWFDIITESYSEKELDKIINNRLSASSQQIRKQLKSEFKKLSIKSFELGKWLRDKELAIKVFIPEIYPSALMAIMEKFNNNVEEYQKTRMYAEIAWAFKENMRNPKFKYNPDED